MTESRQYFSLDSLSYSTTRDLGTEGLHYLATRYVYDPFGRQAVSTDPTGTVTETQYDLAGRTVRTIQNFDGKSYGETGSGFDSNGTPLETSTQCDLTVDYQYLCPCQLAVLDRFMVLPCSGTEGRGCRGRGLVPLLAGTRPAKRGRDAGLPGPSGPARHAGRFAPARPAGCFGRASCGRCFRGASCGRRSK